MSFMDPSLNVSLVLENRRELIVHGTTSNRRELHFKAKTLEMLKINGESVRFGSVVVIEGQETYQDRDIPGVIDFIGDHQGEPAAYQLRLWVNTQAFEDLRTFDQSTDHLETFAEAAAMNGETLYREFLSRSWNAKDEKQLVFKDFAIWIKPNTDIGEFQEPIPEPIHKMTSFEEQVLARIQGIEKSLTWLLCVVFGLGLLLLFRGR